MPPMPPLQFGDVLLFAHAGFFSDIIRLKTWSKITHVEICLDPMSRNLASRNGQGINIYPWDGSVFEIRRPVGKGWPKGGLDKETALTWFNSVKGQPYGWYDLLEFCGIKLTGMGMICSQFADVLLQKAGFDAFPARYAAGRIAPRDFDVSEALTDLWCADPEWNT